MLSLSMSVVGMCALEYSFIPGLMGINCGRGGSVTGGFSICGSRGSGGSGGSQT